MIHLTSIHLEGPVATTKVFRQAEQIQQSTKVELETSEDGVWFRPFGWPLGGWHERSCVGCFVFCLLLFFFFWGGVLFVFVFVVCVFLGGSTPFFGWL